MNRRELLAGIGVTMAGRVWAAPAVDLRLLVVFLRGGYDAANIVVPIGSDLYYQARPNLAIRRPDAADPDAALPLDSDWGLHPALRDSLYPLWQRREIAFVPFTGPSDDLTRSHFETQDTIELGQDLSARRDDRSGFMNRLAASLARARPIAFTDQLPLAFRGALTVPNSSIQAVDGSVVSERQATLIQSMYAGSSLGSSVREGFRVRSELYGSLHPEMPADKGSVSPRGFEFAARRIGRVMRERYNLGFVDVGGWDTHVRQGGAQGYLAERISELGRGLAGFATEIGSAWAETVVVVISEFGRTFRENGYRGTDHGHGSTYWVLGGAIKGGRIVGEQVKLEPARLFEDRDLPVLTDYRSVLGGLLRRMYGLDPGQLGTVFAGSSPRDLDLL